MGARGYVIGLFVTAVFMALFWQIMDMGIQVGIAGSFFGKIVISLVILFISKLLSRILEG